MLFDIITLIIIYLFVLFPKWKAKDKRALIINSIMYVYIGFVLYFTLMPILSAIPGAFFPPFGTVNMNLFVDLINNRGDFMRQIVLNIIMMIPFGLLLPSIKKENCSVIKVLIFTFLFSLIIEVFQPILHGYRSFDVTDLITNTIGGYIGYILYCMVKVLFRLKSNDY